MQEDEKRILHSRGLKSVKILPPTCAAGGPWSNLILHQKKIKPELMIHMRWMSPSWSEPKSNLE